jgi:hypothetical protein
MNYDSDDGDVPPMSSAALAAAVFAPHDKDDDVSEKEPRVAKTKTSSSVTQITTRANTKGDFIYDKRVIDPRNTPFCHMSNGGPMRTRMMGDAVTQFESAFVLIATADDVLDFLQSRIYVSFSTTPTSPHPVQSFVRVLIADGHISHLDADAFAHKLFTMSEANNCIPLLAILNSPELTGKIIHAFNCAPGHEFPGMQRRETLKMVILQHALTGFRPHDISDAFDTFNTSPVLAAKITRLAQPASAVHGFWPTAEFRACLNFEFSVFTHDALFATYKDVLDICTIPSTILAATAVMCNRLVMLPTRGDEAKRAILAIQAVKNTARYGEQRYVGEMFAKTALSFIFHLSPAEKGLTGFECGEIIPGIKTDLVEGQCAGMPPIRYMLTGPCGSWKTQSMCSAVRDLTRRHLHQCAASPPSEWSTLQFIGTTHVQSFVLMLEVALFEAMQTVVAEECTTPEGPPTADGVFPQAELSIGMSKTQWSNFVAAFIPCKFEYKTVRSLRRATTNRRIAQAVTQKIQKCRLAIIVTCAHSEPRVNKELDALAIGLTRVVHLRDEVAAAFDRIKGDAPGKPYTTDVKTLFETWPHPPNLNPNLFCILDVEADATFLFCNSSAETYGSITTEMMNDPDSRVRTYLNIGFAVGPAECISPVTGELDYPQLTLMLNPTVADVEILAHRIALSLLRPTLDGVPMEQDDDDDDVENFVFEKAPVDVPGVQAPPMSSVSLDFPRSRKDAMRDWSIGEIVRALAIKNGLAMAVVEGHVSLPICGLSNDAVGVTHTNAFSMTAELMASHGSEMLTNAHCASLVATSSFAHGASLVVNKPDCLQLVTAKYPPHHNAATTAQGLRRVRTGQVCILTAEEYQPNNGEDVELDGPEFIARRAADRLHQVIIPPSSTTEQKETHDEVLAALQSRGAHFRNMPHGKTPADIGMAKLIARQRYLDSKQSKGRWQRTIDQIMLMTNFVPRIEKNPRKFLNKICGFVTPSQKRFVESIRGYVLMVKRVLDASPGAAERFLVKHDSLCPSLADKTAHDHFKAQQRRAVQHVQTIVTYRAMTFDKDVTYEEAKQMMDSLVCEPQPETPERVQQIMASVENRIRTCPTGHDMTLVAVLYRELGKEPRDRTEVSLVANCIALRQMRYLIEVELRSKRPHESVSARDTMLGLAGFLAMMSFCENFGEINACSIPDAIRKYDTCDNVIPCTMTVVDEAGQVVNLMKHVLAMCGPKTHSAFTKRLRSAVERVANIIVPGAHAGAKLQFMFGKCYPPGDMTSDEAIAYAQQIDELPAKKKVKHATDEAELEAQHAMGDNLDFINNLSELGFDETRCEILPVIETVTTETMYNYMKEHQPEHLNFIFHEGGSFIEMDKDPEVLHVNITKALAELWDDMRNLLNRVAKRGLGNNIALVGTVQPPVDHAAILELEAFARASAVQIDYTAADKRIRDLERRLDGASAADVAKCNEFEGLMSQADNVLKNITSATVVSKKLHTEIAKQSGKQDDDTQSTSSSVRATKAHKRKRAIVNPDEAFTTAATSPSTDTPSQKKRGRPSNKERAERARAQQAEPTPASLGPFACSSSQSSLPPTPSLTSPPTHRKTPTSTVLL